MSLKARFALIFLALCIVNYYFQMSLMYVSKSLFTIGALASAYFSITHRTNVLRVFKLFYWLAKPVCHYLLVSKLHKRGWITEEKCLKWNAKLDLIYAPQSEGLFRSLRGFFIKIAQRCSTRPDVYSEPYMEAFENFLANCPPEPFEVVKSTIEAELKKPLTQIFSRFDEKALGAASIGQAHRATLKETGQEVVVKVQYPWIGEIIDVDFGTMLFLAGLFHEGEYKYLKGISEIYKGELDFRKEAETIRKISTAVNSEFDPRLVHVPIVYDQYCTDNVLVMEYFPGQLLSKFCKQARKGRDMKTEKFSSFTPPTDIELKVIRAGVSLRRKVWNSMASMLNKSFGVAFAGLGRDTSQIVDYIQGLDVNIDQVLDTLIDVTGFQIFHLDVFNIDPHSGNILIDSEGRLGLIDFGQIWESTKQQRELVAKLMLEILKRDKEATIQILKDMGYKSEKDDADFMFMAAVFLFDCFDYELGEKVFGVKGRKEVLKAFKKDKLSEFPPEYFSFVRVSMVLRGVCLNFLALPSFAKHWEKYCLQIVKGTTPRRRKKSMNWFSKMTSFAIKSSTLIVPKADLQTIF